MRDRNRHHDCVRPTGRCSRLFARRRRVAAALAIAGVLAGATGGRAEPGQPGLLDDLMLAQDLWELPAFAVMERGARLGLRWVSAERDAARSDAAGQTFLDQSVVETVVRFDGGKASDVTLSLFNRGDVGDITEAEFEGRVTATERALSALAGVQGKDVTPRKALTAERKVRAVVWVKGPSLYRLEYAYSKRKRQDAARRYVVPEFVNISVVRNAGQTVADLKRQDRTEVGRSALKQRIRRSDAGDVYLDKIPMVDQGRKGYCAVAATERVLRYYGVDVNQHELAQRAATASGGGTDQGSLLKALESMAGPFHIRVRTLDAMSARDLMDLLSEYNRKARRAHLDQIEIPASGPVDLSGVLGGMEGDIFLKVRRRSDKKGEAFARTIRDVIDKGCPVLWGVWLGLVEEEAPLLQKGGGHLRLIIGYNRRTREVLYSDSWGAGHEMKRMSLVDAAAVSTSLFTIEPR